MEHLTIELVLWLLLAFFVGCIIGCLLRNLASGQRPQGLPALRSDEETAQIVAAGTEATMPNSPTLETAIAEVVTILPEVMPVPEGTAAVGNQEPSDRRAAGEMIADRPAVMTPTREVMPTPDRLASDTAKSATQGRPADLRSRRPQGLPAPREDRPDNLQRISGIGPKLEKTLHDLGFFHYDQIAAWDSLEVVWVNEHLRFRGRVEREQWIEQARLLANGEEERFAQLYGVAGQTDGGGSSTASRGRRGQGGRKS